MKEVIGKDASDTSEQLSSFLAEVWICWIQKLYTRLESYEFSRFMEVFYAP